MSRKPSSETLRGGLADAGRRAARRGAGAGRGWRLDLSVLDLPREPGPVIAAPEASDLDLQLAVFINGQDEHVLIPVTRRVDGSLAVDPTELSNAGIKPAREALRRDGSIDPMKLPHVETRYDPTLQELHFTAGDAYRVPRTIAARERDVADAEKGATGAVLNYTFQGSGAYGIEDSEFDYNGVSGDFDGWIFGPLAWRRIRSR